jgi:porin
MNRVFLMLVSSILAVSMQRTGYAQQWCFSANDREARGVSARWDGLFHNQATYFGAGASRSLSQLPKHQMPARLSGFLARGQDPAEPGSVVRRVDYSQDQTVGSGETTGTAPASEGSIADACPSCGGTCCDDLCCRSRLLGDLGGLGPQLVAHGIVPDLSLTQFYQGVTSGGRNTTFDYGGKLDYMFTFLGEPLGLNKGFTALFHAETRFGEDVILDAAPLAPANANLLYPSLDNETAITGLQFIQAVSEEWAFTFGKINTFDLFNTLYPQTGRGVSGFMNAYSFLPLTVARTIPLSFLGAGVMKLQEGKIQGSFLVYDSHNIPTTSGFDDLFDNGANLLGMWRFFTDFGGLPGSHLFMGTYANGTFTSLDRTGWSFVPQVGLVAAEDTGTWSATYILEQKLWVDPCCEQRSVGLLSEWGLADPKTGPYQWGFNVALQGQGLIERREQDTMGVAYFYSGISNDLKDLAPRLLPLDDLQGVELYYNAAVTPWFHLTADLQVVEPAFTRNDTAVVLGLRGKMDF